MMKAWCISAVVALLCFAISATAEARPHKRKHHQVRAQYDSTVIGGRPAQCRIVARGKLIPFCGCALSLRIFGTVNPALNLAANWFRFPRARPAPEMVAARRGHVFQLVRHVEGNTWVVWDANSGGGKIRLHQRSIAGYVIVNPHSSRMAVVQERSP